MKKLFTFLLALMASSCLWASITYELNDGGTGEAKYNDYGWNNKSEMFAAFMTDAGATGFETLDDYKASDSPLKGSGICSKMTTPEKAFENQAKWGWLKDYIRTVQNAQTGAPTLDDTGKGNTWYYAVGAFFVEMKLTSWPYSADFTEAGKDAAYLPAWGQNYGNPTAPTEEVTLVAPYRTGYLFDGWYDNPECTGTPITTVNASTTGTLYAKWVSDGIFYELNGGVWNEYEWEDKGDMYDAFISEWKAYEGSDVTNRVTVPYEDQLGIGKSNGGIPTTIGTTALRDNLPAMFMHNDYSAKWGWLAKYMDIVAATQYKKMNAANGPKVQPTTNGAALTFSLGNFFGEDKNHTTDYIDAVDFTGEEAHLAAFQSTWGQTFPNPEHPTEEVTLHTPFKEGCKFLGWYDNEACTGTPVTKVDQNDKGTLYAKWVMDGIVYERNGGVWNEYGWTSKKDMYDAFLADWKAYSGSPRATKTYEEQLGVGKSSVGIPGTIYGDELRAKLLTFFTDVNYQTKWGWLATYIDAIAAQQGKTQPTTNGATLTFSLGNFFGEDNEHATDYIGAVDFTGSEAQVEAFQYTWGQSFPGIEHPTESTVLHIAYKQRYNFEGWYDNAECTGTAITTVDENYAGTLYAKWSLAPVLYNLNGGQYNQYGWKSKKDVYDDFIADWNTYSGTTRKTAQYEDQLGVGKSNGGIPTTIGTTALRDNLPAMFMHNDYSAKWGWLAEYMDVVAATQYKKMNAANGSKVQPTTNGAALTFSLGNFFGEDKNHTTDYIDAVDFTGDERYLVSAQTYCSFTLPNPTYPTSEVTINNPTKEGYIFDGWYASADFSGAKVTKVKADTKGTLYAKWKEDAYSRTVTNGNYGTICLPKGSKQTSGAIFYELACKDAQYVYLDQVTILEAGVPYIFKATSNTLKVVYNTTEVATAGNHNGLYGTFVDIQDAATSDPNNVLEGNYLLVSNTIKKCGVNCKVLANRAYIKLEEIPNSASAAPGRNRVSMKYEGENEATGLDNITEDSNIAPALQGTYDIMGRKLTEPSTTGFYIVNGKKVIIMK